MVYTPVGTRCRTCANLKPLPMFQVGPAQYARAIGAALALGIVGGLLWAFVGAAVPFISFWLVLLMGYASGESISRATNRKQGRWLQVIAGAGVLLAYILRGMVPALMRFPALAFSGSFFLESTLRELAVLFTNPLLLLVFALAIYIAVRRVQ
jgi:mannose/fructose/N-acetylgalactosamine-specific phosphotransferase system component IID